MGTPPDGHLDTLDQATARLGSELRRTGALGLLAVCIPGLERVERLYGARPHDEVLERVAARVHDVVSGFLGEGDAIVAGELSRDEVLVMLFRDRRDTHFFRDELPDLARELTLQLRAAEDRIVYPYGAELSCTAGYARGLDDSTVQPARLLRGARDQAVSDAMLKAEIEQAQRRERFLSILFSEEVRVVFEPIAGLETGRALGFEALVRGESGTELANPDQLFQAARQSGALFELDCLCRRVALRAAHRLPDGAKLFLNTLPSAIHDPAFQAGEVGAVLQAHRLHPSDIVFEISERESIRNLAIFREVCDHYSRLGFQIAMDDVGSGYSGLEVIAELQPDYLKVDIGIVRNVHEDPSRQEMLKALASIGSRIGAKLIAEGIECQEELETLRDLGVTYGQGYHIGRATELKPDSEDA